MYVCTIFDISNMIVGCLSRLIDLSVIFGVRVCLTNSSNDNRDINDKSVDF